MARKKEIVDMTKGPFFKKILIFAIPVILTGFLQQFYNMADLIVVGQFVSANALSAVGATSPITAVATGFFLGIAIGGGVCAAHSVGAKREHEVGNVLHTSFVLSTVLGIFIGAVGIIFAPQFLMLMDTPADIMDMSVLYLRIVFFGVPANLIYSFMAAIMRACGDSKRPLLFLSVSGIFNIVFNVICVTVFDLGVFGVALSTAIANYLALIMIMVYLMRQKGYLRFSFRMISVDIEKLKKILKIGVPSGIQSTLFNISNASIQAAVNGFGSDVIAGVTAAGSIMSLITMSMHGLYEASVTFVGQNYGAGNYRNIKKVLLNCVSITVLIGTLMGALVVIFRYPLINLYTKGDEGVTAAAITRLLIMGPLYVTFGVFDTVNGALRAIGKSFTSMVISIFGIIFLRLLWLWTIFKLIPTPVCLYWSYPASWMTTMFIVIIVFIYFYRKLVREHEVQRTEAEKTEVLN